VQEQKIKQVLSCKKLQLKPPFGKLPKKLQNQWLGKQLRQSQPKN